MMLCAITPRATSTIFTAALIPHKTSLYNSRQRRDHVISACPTAQSREEKGIKASPSLIMKRNLRGRLIHAHNQKHLKRSNFSYHCDMMPKPSHAITIKKQWRNAIPSLRFQVEWNLIKRIHAYTGTLWPENTSFPHWHQLSIGCHLCAFMSRRLSTVDIFTVTCTCNFIMEAKMQSVDFLLNVYRISKVYQCHCKHTGYIKGRGLAIYSDHLKFL